MNALNALNALNVQGAPEVPDWSQYGGRELRIGEVRALAGGETFWGWHEGMYIAGNDDYIALRLYHGEPYENVTRELWRRASRGAEFVIDVGAHSGIFTLDAFRSGAKRVFSAEPHPINFSRLVMNLKYNKFDTNRVFYGACGEKNGVESFLARVLLNCHAAGRTGLTKQGKPEDQKQNWSEFPVAVARLDAIIGQKFWPLVRAVKIDAENYTSKVLKGMGMMLEYRPDLILESTTTSGSGMEEILKPLGYKFWRIWETGRIEECEDLSAYDPDKEYNGTHQDCRNRFASVKGLPD